MLELMLILSNILLCLSIMFMGKAVYYVFEEEIDWFLNKFDDFMSWMKKSWS